MNCLSGQHEHRCNLSAHARVLLFMMENGGFRRNYVVLVFNEIQQCFFYSDF